MKKIIKTIKILILVALLSFGTYTVINIYSKPVEKPQEAQKDPRLEEYMNSESFKHKQELQAKLELLEADRLAEIADDERVVKLQKEEHTTKMLKINMGMDTIRKEQLELAKTN